MNLALFQPGLKCGSRLSFTHKAPRSGLHTLVSSVNTASEVRAKSSPCKPWDRYADRISRPIRKCISLGAAHRDA